MGSIGLPTSGRVYVDAQVIIYSIEHHPAFSPPLQPFWKSVRAGDVEALTSEVTILETLVLPLRHGDRSLQAAYESALVRNGTSTVRNLTAGAPRGSPATRRIAVASHT